MSRIQTEWRRLYLPLNSAQGQTRAMVLALGKPADWALLSALWQGVQADLGLPAPAIAVSGTDSYQLWFSLAQAVSEPEAQAFLDALRQRYLADVPSARISMLTTVDADAPQPGQEVSPDQWCAFVAPDLAPVFEDTPWLDIPPKPDGQAELLARLQAIQATAWQAAIEKLKPAPAASSITVAAHSGAGTAIRATKPPYQDPKHFLMDVMNDDTIALGLRIEAAKALLPHEPRA